MVLNPWKSLDASNEFRCFFHSNTLTGISTYSYLADSVLKWNEKTDFELSCLCNQIQKKWDSVNFLFFLCSLNDLFFSVGTMLKSFRTNVFKKKVFFYSDIRQHLENFGNKNGLGSAQEGVLTCSHLYNAF